MSTLLGIVAAALLTIPGSPGGWQRVRFDDSAGERAFKALSVVGDEELFLAGFAQTNPGSMLPNYAPLVLASDDGGRTTTNVTGGIALPPLDIPLAAWFSTSTTGFVAAGAGLFRTVDRGATWGLVDLGGAVHSLHFFDGTRGVATTSEGGILRTSDGGATWLPAESPAKVPLRHQFWLDDQHGWATGAGSRWASSGPMGTSWLAPDQGVLLWTTDGGATWEQRDPAADRAFGVPFFLDDGQTGWVVAEELFDESGGTAHLLRTLDGGRTLEEIALPSVGTLQVGSFPIALTFFRIVAMRWSDRDHGRIVGSALVWYHKTSDANPEGQTRICRVVDIETADGGATWSESGLGTIAMDSANPGKLPQNDGELFAGLLRADGSGWLVGDRLAVWAHPGTGTAPESPDTADEDGSSGPGVETGCGVGTTSGGAGTGLGSALLLLLAGASLWLRRGTTRCAC